MTKITFNSYIDWEEYAKDYCCQTMERIFEMPEQKDIDSIIEDVFYRGLADEYNLSVMDVEITDEMKAEVERGVRAYITEQIEENVVPATVFETICEALDDSADNSWFKRYLKEDKQYTKADLCGLLHAWLDDNEVY